MIKYFNQNKVLVYLSIFSIIWHLFGHFLLFIIPEFVNKVDDSDKILFEKIGNDTLFKRLVMNAARFDAFYFLKITESGYLNEKNHAFFPLLPAILRLFSSLFHFLHEEELIRIVIILFFINIIISPLSTVLFYKFTKLLIKHEKIVIISTIFFTINTSSCFYKAVYTESLFCFF